MSENIFDWCKANKDTLLEAKRAGNSCAQNIVSVHDMYVRHPDRIALTILEELVNDWKKGEPDASEC